MELNNIIIKIDSQKRGANYKMHDTFIKGLILQQAGELRIVIEETRKQIPGQQKNNSIYKDTSS